MEEFERWIEGRAGGRAFRLRLWAMNYGTHIGATLRFFDEGADRPFIDLSFESHWNAPGRYIIRQGAAKADANDPAAQRAMVLAGPRVVARLARHFAGHGPEADIYRALEADADALLWDAAGALVA